MNNNQNIKWHSVESSGYPTEPGVYLLKCNNKSEWDFQLFHLPEHPELWYRFLDDMLTTHWVKIIQPEVK